MSIKILSIDEFQDLVVVQQNKVAVCGGIPFAAEFMLGEMADKVFDLDAHREYISRELDGAQVAREFSERGSRIVSGFCPNYAEVIRKIVEVKGGTSKLDGQIIFAYMLPSFKHLMPWLRTTLVRVRAAEATGEESPMLKVLERYACYDRTDLSISVARSLGYWTLALSMGLARTLFDDPDLQSVMDGEVRLSEVAKRKFGSLQMQHDTLIRIIREAQTVTAALGTDFHLVIDGCSNAN